MLLLLTAVAGENDCSYDDADAEGVRDDSDINGDTDCTNCAVVQDIGDNGVQDDAVDDEMYDNNNNGDNFK